MRSSGVCLCPKFLHSAPRFPEEGWGRIAGGHVSFSHAEVIDRDAVEAAKVAAEHHEPDVILLASTPSDGWGEDVVEAVRREAGSIEVEHLMLGAAAGSGS